MTNETSEEEGGHSHLSTSLFLTFILAKSFCLAAMSLSHLFVLLI